MDIANLCLYRYRQLLNHLSLILHIFVVIVDEGDRHYYADYHLQFYNKPQNMCSTSLNLCLPCYCLIVHVCNKPEGDSYIKTQN